MQIQAEYEIRTAENPCAAEENSGQDTVVLTPEQQMEIYCEMLPDIQRVCRTVKKKPVYSFVKRVFDLIAATVALVLLSPLFLFVTLKIRSESKGPAIFRQQRVGMNGKLFTMYKFRSMCIDAEDKLDSVLRLNKSGNTLMFKAEDDPRITPFGKKIRKTSIDELPQLINIIRGEMSFVGPRPPLVREVIQYEDDWAVRLGVKGGLTCYWQLAGRNDADFAFCIEQDRKYLAKRSWWTDLKLIFMTVGHVFAGKGS